MDLVRLQGGQGIVEYALILILVSILVIVMIYIFGGGVGNLYSNIIHAI
jgi:pilus assembly protein Flp/PilA